jgi:putative membrane protein
MTGLLISWALTALSLLIVSYVLPGFQVSGITTALIAAIVIGLVNGTLGFVLKLLTFPITFLTLGLFSLVINALMILLSARLVSGFNVDGFLPAFLGAILLSVVNAILGTIFKPKKSS